MVSTCFLQWSVGFSPQHPLDQASCPRHNLEGPCGGPAGVHPWSHLRAPKEWLGDVNMPSGLAPGLCQPGLQAL